MNTAADPRFDRLTRTVAERYKVPIATIAFVGETTVWYKSGHGLPPTTFQNPARDITFAGHAILKPDAIFVLEDARADPRFEDSPLVVGPPFVRFYAAYPLCDSAGLPVGALTMLDHSPRIMTEAERVLFGDFARHAETLIALHASSQRLERAETHDRLTGLGNRSWFAERLDHMAGAGPCCLFHVDLDDFGRINDSYGVNVGDQILKEIAQRLLATQDETAVVARLGDNAFGILVPRSSVENGPEAMARKIVEAVSLPYRRDDTKIPLGASVGIAVYPTDVEAPTMLSRHANQALRMAKTAERAGIARIADDGADPIGMPTRSMEYDLLRAIKNKGFELHWQPIADLRTFSHNPRNFPLCGYEGLLRWDRPGFGHVSPGKFIPLAECSGYITDIDIWVLKEACKQAATWSNGTDVSVNISAEWFGRDNLMEIVEAALAETALAPARLEMEITEGLLIKNAKLALKNIQALKAIGVRVALDDFGTGRSSLAHLIDFPFDTVKLDGSFTRSLRENPSAAAVTRAAIQLGHELGMVVCAEGVEELWHLEFLCEHGCDRAQGYLFGRPSLVPQLPGAGQKTGAAVSAMRTAMVRSFA